MLWKYYNIGLKKPEHKVVNELLYKTVIEIENHKRLSGNDLFSLLEYIMLYGSKKKDNIISCRNGVMKEHA